MKVLFLTQIIPFPPDAGPKIKTWHVLRYLIECGHQVALASFVRPEEWEHVPILEKLCKQVHTVPIKRSRSADIKYWLRSNVSGRPFLIERDDLSAMHNLVQRILSTQRIDAIQADQLTMTQFALRARQQYKTDAYNDRTGSNPGPTLIFDAHNAVWTIVERMFHNAPWYLKSALSLETQRIKRYEGLIVREFDHTLAVTEIDRQALKDAVIYSSDGVRVQPPPIPVIPIAVDTSQLQPIKRKQASNNILTLGTLHYPPNADGIRWFMQEVFPLIKAQVPKVTLTIVGKNPPKDFLEYASREYKSVHVTGYVPNLKPYLEEAAMMVVPVRAGGGMRVRILEAFAQGMPTVTTTVGLEGIDARPNEEVLVSDTPSDFASSAVQLLQDESLQTRLANHGRRLVEERYDWRVVLKKMDTIYNQIERMKTSF